MVLISSLTPLEQIHTKEDITSQDWFLLQTGIKKKSLSDDNLQTVYNRLYLYSFWYKETPYLYLMSDKYYYGSQIHTLLPKSYETMIHKRIPSCIKSEYIKQYPMIKERTITESDIDAAFKVLLNNNFKKNQITQTILGETRYQYSFQKTILMDV